MPRPTFPFAVLLAPVLPAALGAQAAGAAAAATAPAAVIAFAEPPAGPVALAPAGARLVARDTVRSGRSSARARLGPGAWLGGAGGCRAVVPRWTALGAVLGLATPLALRAVGADRPRGKDLAAGAALGAGAGAVTGAVMCRQARAG
jgi:hypothetical protein